MTTRNDDERSDVTDASTASSMPGTGRAEPAEPAKSVDESSDTSSAQDRQDGLMAHDAVMDFRARWEAIQQGFVDDPRAAVTDADSLVGDVMERLSDTFDDQHQELERQWSDGEPSTEDLRAALQRYRDFFQRLLAV